MSNKKDYRKMLQDIDLARSYVSEQGIETFAELVQEHPEQSAKLLPHFLEKVLSAGDNIFRGLRCGGPDPLVTAPLISMVGSVYPLLGKPCREKSSDACLNFLDGLNYIHAQTNMEFISEPWLVGYIISNRWLYWCGYKEYSDKLKEIDNMTDFEAEFIHGKKLTCKIVFWLSYAISRPKQCPSKHIRYVFAEMFPKIVDRTKDRIAAIVNYQASYAEA